VVATLTDPDADGYCGPSSGGVPFLFSPVGLCPFNSLFCRAAGVTEIGGPALLLEAGQTRYVATFVFVPDDAAEGAFEISFLCNQTPSVPCDESYPLSISN
jgi:hypothetical protein